MIDISNEQVVTLKQACKILPARTEGKKLHYVTLWRWSTAGVKGVVLETIQIGGTRCTSIEALQRFFDALSSGGTPSTHRRSPARRQRDLEAAEKELEAMGV